MKVKITNSLESVSDTESNLIFIVNKIFSYGDYLFIFGKENVDLVDGFLKEVQKKYEYNCEVFSIILNDGNIKKLIEDGNGFCTEPYGSVGGVVFIPSREDDISIMYHELVHLVDYIIDLSGISNDTEVRAVIFEYYERILTSKRKSSVPLGTVK